MAYEDIITLANRTLRDIWINIPVLATDDYVCRLARLLAYGEPGDKSNSPCNPTAPGSGTVPPLTTYVNLYIEDANEEWNEQFPQFNELFCYANGMPTGSWGHTMCTNGTTSPSAYVAAQLLTPPWGPNGFFNMDPYGKTFGVQMLTTYRNKMIFRQVFQTAGRPLPINILSMRSGDYDGCNYDHCYYVRQFWNQNYPELPFDAVAYAPYLSPSCVVAPVDPTVCPNGIDTTVDQVFADISNAWYDPNFGMKQEIIGDMAQGMAMGVPVAFYEGGLSWAGDDTTLQNNATEDPRAKQWTLTYLNEMAQVAPFGIGPGKLMVFNWFSYADGWSQFGNWGALTNQADCTGNDIYKQRWLGIMSYVGQTICTP
jgi:hypothetical protein